MAFLGCFVSSTEKVYRGGSTLCFTSWIMQENSVDDYGKDGGPGEV